MKEFIVSPNLEITMTTLKEDIKEYVAGRDELLKNPDDTYPLNHPLAGHCYIISEAYFHLNGGYTAFTVERCEVPVKEPNDGGTVRFTHWYLRHRDTGEVLDLTAEQFTEYEHDDVEIPYEDGVSTGFMTKEPSKRAKQIIDEVSEDSRILTDSTTQGA